MTLKRIGLFSLVIGIGLGTAACTDGYGFSGLSVGYGSGGYGSGGYYGDGYDSGYGYGNGYNSAYGAPYYGWYNDYYYPGTGIYVYDQYRRPFRWNDGQRRYWEGRRNNWRGDRNYRNDWNGFQRRGDHDGRYDGDRRNGGDRNWNGGDHNNDGGQRYRNDGGNRGDWRNRRGGGNGAVGNQQPGVNNGYYQRRENRGAAPNMAVSPQAAIRTPAVPAQVEENRRRRDERRGERQGREPYVNVRPQ
ncbi:MAG: peptidase [Pseudomonadota bacterium]|nr:peptidase [Pseudomonadota bacterium]